MKRPRKPLKKVSDKRAGEWKVYLPLKRHFLAMNPYCMRCLGKSLIKNGYLGVSKHVPATQIHHWAGRRSNFLKVETWRASCDECNLWAKNHPKEARAEGWIAPEGVYLT